MINTQRHRIELRALMAIFLVTMYVVVRAQDKSISIYSYQDTSCGAWVISAGNPAARAQYISWFRGFVSGYHYGNPGNQVELGRLPDADTMALYIDKSCRENPLQSFVAAAFHLVDEVRERPVTSKPKLQ